MDKAEGSATGAVKLRLLGPVEMAIGASAVLVNRRSERCVLAVLALEVNRHVQIERLIRVLWGEHPPENAVAAIQTYVSRLRKAFVAAGGDQCRDWVVGRPGGYQLRLAPEAVDTVRFSSLDTEARRTGDPGYRATLLREALALWRGEALADLGSTPELDAIRLRLGEQRLAALAARVEADLALGRHGELIGELSELVGLHPSSERLAGQLMLALCGAGRRGEALEVYQRLRRQLAAELGLEPGEPLRRLESAILRGEAAAAPRVEAGRSTRGTAVPPAQLPAGIAGFTGRNDHLAYLDRQLTGLGREPLAVIVTGGGGIGKTALAVHWATSALAHFPDGQLFVDLRGFSTGPAVPPVEALGVLLRALGTRAEDVPVEMEEAAALFRSVLAGRRMLVVLDNAESAQQVRPLLPGAPGCMVLVTSRERLSGLVTTHGARRLALDVLDAKESGDLFAGLLGRRVAEYPASLASLHRICGGLPLAIRIAAAQLADAPQWSVEDYCAAAESHPLETLVAGGEPAVALRASLDLSYQRLDGTQRQTFRLLGLTACPAVSMEAAGALAGLPLSRIGAVMHRLAAVHLVEERPGGWYGMHDLVRRYAAEKAAAGDSAARRSEATARLADWYLHTADAAAQLLHPDMLRLPVPSPPGWPASTLHSAADARQWLDAELANLMAVIRSTAESGPRRYAWLLADRLRGYFSLRRLGGEWLAAAGAAEQAGRVEHDPLAQASAGLNQGYAHYYRGDFDRAIEHYTKALQLSRQAGWTAALNPLLGNIGLARLELGRLDSAANAFEQSLTQCRASGDTAGEAKALARLGYVYAATGPLSRAHEVFERAVALDAAAGAAQHLHNLYYLGSVCQAMGRFPEALQHLNDALVLSRRHGDSSEEAASLAAIAKVYRDAGQLSAALAYAEKAIETFGDTLERRLEGELLTVLASIHRCLGEPKVALGILQRAVGLAEQTGAPAALSAALATTATTLLDTGDLGGARAQAEQAVALANKAGDRLLRGEASTALAGALLAGGEVEPALAVAERTLSLQRRIGHIPGEMSTLALLAEAARLSGRPDSGHLERRLTELRAAIGTAPDGMAMVSTL